MGLALVAALAAYTASAVSVSVSGTASAWLREHPAAQGDELAELKGENPEAYAIVKALLTKRSLGLLDPRHPTASFAVTPAPKGEEASGAAAFARFADAPKATALYPEAPAAPPRHNWFGWKPSQSAVDDDAMVKNVLGAATSAMEAGRASPGRSLRSAAADPAPEEEEKEAAAEASAAAPAVMATPALPEVAEATGPAASMSQENSYLKGIDFSADLSPKDRKAVTSMSAMKHSLSHNSQNYLASFSWDDEAPTTGASATAQAAKSGEDESAPRHPPLQEAPAATTATGEAPKEAAPKPSNALLSWLGGGAGRASVVKPSARSQAPTAQAVAPAVPQNSYLSDLQ